MSIVPISRTADKRQVFLVACGNHNGYNKKNTRFSIPTGKYLGMANDLAAAGHKVYLINGNDYRMEELARQIASRARQGDIVGMDFYSGDGHLLYARKLSETLSRECSEVIQVAGGPEISYRSKQELSEFPHIDFFVRGEGEYPMRALIEGDFDRHRIGEQRVLAPGRTFDMNDWGWQARAQIQMLPGNARDAVIHFLRGCEGRCRFCVPSPSSIRPRTAGSVIGEMQYMLQHRLIPKDREDFNLDILASDVSASEEPLVSFLEFLTSQPHRFYFRSSARPDTFWQVVAENRRVFRAFARKDNSMSLDIGFDGGYPQLLHEMDKYSSERVARLSLKRLVQIANSAEEIGLKEIELDNISILPDSTILSIYYTLKVFPYLLMSRNHFTASPQALFNTYWPYRGSYYFRKYGREWWEKSLGGRESYILARLWEPDGQSDCFSEQVKKSLRKAADQDPNVFKKLVKSAADLFIEEAVKPPMTAGELAKANRQVERAFAIIDEVTHIK